jgi:putative Mn2+ efflux pump MntP
MRFLPWILFALSANADNFAVGLCYGIRRIKVGFKSNLIIALITFSGTILSMTAGKLIFGLISPDISRFIGSGILILLGIWTLLKSLFKNRQSYGILEYPEKADKDNSQHIDIKEAVPLALALTVNNIGIGIGASAAGLDIFFTSAATFFFSMLTIMAGYLTGLKYFSKILNKKAAVISAFIIIFLGIFEIFI